LASTKLREAVEVGFK